MFKNCTIHKKLYTVLGFLIFSIFTIGEWSLWQSNLINTKVNNLYTQEIIPLENLSHLKGALYRIRDHTLHLSDTKDPQKIQLHTEIIKQQFKRIENELDIYDNTRLSKEEQKQLKYFKKNLKKYAIINFAEAREALNVLTEYQLQRAKERHTHSDHIFKQQIFIIQFILFFVIILAIYFSRELVRSILNPVSAISNALEYIVKSDFSRKITSTEKNEFGHIITMLNQNTQLLQSTFEELDTLANYDSLTHLPNRRMFLKELELSTQRCPIDKTQCAVMFLDLDNFKKVNDTYGHNIGDELLYIIAQRISSQLRKSDMLARLGGDEFAIILHNIDNYTIPGNIANKIIQALEQPFYLHEHTLFSSMSIGIYIQDDDEVTYSEIMSYADVAMYAAKNAGKNQYIYFNETMHTKIKEEAELETALRDALKNKELKVFFQPIIHADTELLYGIETLLRWQRDNSLILPDKFIKKLESSGLIVDVTYYIIEEVFKMVHKISFKEIVSINLSILQFYDTNFISFLKRMLLKYERVNPELISFEITETIFAQESEFIQSYMELIENIGFKFSLDDFGTGYSSLSYIKEYPINTLKIDKKFIDNIIYDEKSKKLFDAIVLMAQSLDMTVVVEGVEDKKTLEIVTKNSSVKIQGFYYYKPMSSNDFLKFMT